MKVRVSTGDSMFTLAVKYLGSGMAWKAIWQANPHIKDPDLILPGQMLTIPREPWVFWYENWEHKFEVRRVIPHGAPYWGSNKWHKEPQWLQDAYDLDREADRTFAMRDIHHIREASQGGSTPSPDA